MKTTIALATLLVAGAVSAPAFADSFDNDWYVTQLQQRGVNAIEVYEGAPGEVRAVVKTADGQQIFQYFDEDTLAQIGANTGTNTRVMTKLDTGAARERVPVTNNSLLEDHFFD